MKITKAQAQSNRAHIVETASALFRERGYDGIGISDLMGAAGFTHGGFYKHFKSKADLIAEAASSGFSQTEDSKSDVNPRDFITVYLSREHRDTPSKGCTIAALSGDASRQSEELKTIFATGVERLLANLECGHEEAKNEISTAESRARQIEIMAQAIGAIVMSRACPDISPLADEILEVCRTAILSRLPE